ncbi:SNF2 family N-terminal domain-containing protein, partial [Suillus americanus]
DESKSKSKSKKAASQSDSDSDSDEVVTKKKPGRAKGKDALFHAKWFRIVLDEAHNIKNRNTRAAIACCELDGKFRWCLTGTPMQNTVDRLFSLLNFFRVRPLNDWQNFNEQIAQPIKAGRPVRALKRLHVVLQSIMLRRTRDLVLNGKPIISLPLRHLLRQACNHPSLVYKDYRIDSEAAEPRPTKNDELATLLGQIGVSNGKKCQLFLPLPTQTTAPTVLKLLPRPDASLSLPEIRSLEYASRQLHEGLNQHGTVSTDIEMELAHTVKEKVTLNFQGASDSFKRHADPSLLICELPWLSDIREASSSSSSTIPFVIKHFIDVACEEPREDSIRFASYQHFIWAHNAGGGVPTSLMTTLQTRWLASLWNSGLTQPVSDYNVTSTYSVTYEILCRKFLMDRMFSPHHVDRLAVEIILTARDLAAEGVPEYESENARGEVQGREMRVPQENAPRLIMEQRRAMLEQESSSSSSDSDRHPQATMPLSQTSSRIPEGDVDHSCVEGALVG